MWGQEWGSQPHIHRVLPHIGHFMHTVSNIGTPTYAGYHIWVPISSKTHRKMTLASSSMLKIHRKSVFLNSNTLETCRKLTLLNSSLFKMHRKLTLRSSNLLTIRRKSTLLNSNVSRTRRKITLPNSNLLDNAVKLHFWLAICLNYVVKWDFWAQEKPSEAHSGHVWPPTCSKWAFWEPLFWIFAQARKALKISLLELILAISGPMPPKCSKLAFWGPFWPYLGPGPQSAQNEVPETHSGHIWAQAGKVLKMRLLRPIPTISGPWPPKCSKWASWDPFWPHVDPGRQNSKWAPEGRSDHTCGQAANWWTCVCCLRGDSI